MPTEHLIEMLKDFPKPDVFSTKLTIGKEVFLNRLDHIHPLMAQYDVVHVLRALERLQKSSEYEANWITDVEANMQPFVVQQIVRLLLRKELGEDTLALMDQIRAIKNNLAYNKFMDEYPKFFNLNKFTSFWSEKTVAQ